MAKELLLYTGIYDYTASELIKSLEEYKSQNVKLRVNTGGGGVLATWGLAAKIGEHGHVKIHVDGAAISSGCNLLMYAEEVECLDVSTFLFHKAVWEGYGDPPAEMKAFTEKVNADLRKKMEAKVDSSKLKALKGYSIAELFESPERINLFLTASDMKQLGIVSKINILEPSEMKAVNDRMKLVAGWDPEMVTRIAAEQTQSQNQNSNIMTLADLKEKFPTVYAEAIAAGKKEAFDAGIKTERDRIGAAMVFAHIDAEGVKKIIASGEAMTATQQSEFLLKSVSAEHLKKIKADNKGGVKTDEVADGDDAAQNSGKKEAEDFVKDVRASLGLDGKNGSGREISHMQKVVN